MRNRLFTPHPVSSCSHQQRCEFTREFNLSNTCARRKKYTLIKLLNSASIVPTTRDKNVMGSKTPTEQNMLVQFVLV